MSGLSGVWLFLTTVATVAVMWVRMRWAKSLPEISVAIPGLLWAVALLVGKVRVRTAWVLLPLTGVLVLAAIQLGFGITVYPWPTQMAALYWAGNLATLFVALQVLGDRERRVRYLNALLIFGVGVAVFSVIQAITSQGMVYWTFPDPLVPGPIFGPFVYVNQFAAFIELLLPIALYYAITRERGRSLYIVAAAVLFGAVIYGGSRGGAVLVLGEIVAVPILASRRDGVSRGLLLNLGGILAVAVLWIWVVAGPDQLVGKLGANDPFGGRREFNYSSLAMFKARPLQGFGLGNWPTAYPGYASFDDGKYANQAHNDWAQWAVEGGLPMFLLMLSVAVWAVPRAVRSVWGLGVLAIFLHCLVDYPIQATGVAIVFFTMMAAIAPYSGRAVAVARGRETEVEAEMNNG